MGFADGFFVSVGDGVGFHEGVFDGDGVGDTGGGVGADVSQVTYVGVGFIEK